MDGDTLPAGMSLVSASGANCAATVSGLNCSAVNIAAGGSPVVITVTVHVASSVADGVTLTNSPSAFGNETDPNAANNSDSEDTPVVRKADVSLVKADGGLTAV